MPFGVRRVMKRAFFVCQHDRLLTFVSGQLMKILLLNQVFHPDVVSTAQHLSDLAAALVERGHQVTVVTGRRAYDEPEKLFPVRETWRGVRIYRISSTRFGKKTKWRRAADFASFIVNCCARLLFLPRHDVVVALTTPPLISFIGAWRAKLWRARFCYWVMDFNPDEAVAAGWLDPDSCIGKLLERMSRFSLRRANKIIALDRFMRDRIVAKGIPDGKVAVIPPWSQDGDVHFDPAGREAFRRQHGLENKFVVMYSGNHSPVHPLDTLMQAADLLKAEDSIIFCFIGGGSEFKRVQRWAEEWGKAENGRRIAGIVCLPYQPLDRLSASLSAADAQVVVMGNAMLGLVHPCKIYNMLAVAAPVIYIGPKCSHVTEILDSPGEGHPQIRVEHFDAKRLADGIRRLAAAVPNKRQALPAASLAPFSKKALLPEMISAIENAPPGKLP
jgi:colanic acid biosynthesis glycosyl transferase WcaI